ncbi:MAG: glutathione synthase [Betaproteobacteria bacterium]|nr:glutathione synthase [Betaproteobacteria bacterium]
MDIAFIVDPLDSLKAYKDSSVSMMRAAAKRGHRIHAFEQTDLVLRAGRVTAQATPLTIESNDERWHEAGTAALRALEEFDAVLMRKDPPFDMEYIYSTYLLELAETAGARIYNRPRAVRDHNEKLAIAKYPQFTAPTIVTRQPDVIREFLAEHRDIILKPLDGMGGTSIFRVREADHNVNVILEIMTQDGKRSTMAQRYIPAISHGDKRILLIAGEPVPFSLARIPKAGESRGNLAAGGRGVAQPLSAHDRHIAETLGPGLWAEGLLLVGLDVIGDNLTEVNVTSPTCMVEITEQTGFDVPGMFIDALERVAR